MQLSLFPDHELHPVDAMLTERANNLLEMLNEGRNEKERYWPQFYFQERDMVVLIAADRNRNMLCNIIDRNGNTPEGFSACWRTAQHIRHELNL